MKHNVKSLLSLLSAAAFSTTASSAVYVVAHPDDDMLLMGPNLVNDIQSNYPTVIIVITAGDAGLGRGTQLSSIPLKDQTTYNDSLGNNPYYRVRLTAREEALMVWLPSAYPKSLSRTWEYLDAATPSVEKITLGNVVEYHLNLPDAFHTNAKTFLQNLRDDPNFSAQDVEGLNTYTGAVLRQTIRTIISSHNHGIPTLVINYPEPVATSSSPPADHIDHTAAGRITQLAITEQPAYQCMWQAIYPGYPAANINPNSPSDAQFWFPNLLEAQRAGYERAHAVMLDQGNVTPVTGGPVSNHPTWSQTTFVANYTDRQRGTMDAFHISFYGKAKWRAVASTGPCNL